MFAVVRPEHPNHFSTGLYPTPIDRYLAALANVKAAEVDFLTAEAVEREEAAIRRRLEEIEAQRRHSQVLGSRQPYDYSQFPGTPRHSEDYRLRLLRRQAEEEDLRRAVVAKEREAEVLRRREIEKRRILVARRQEEALLSQLRREEERRRLLLQQKARSLALAHQGSVKQPATYLVVRSADSRKPLQKSFCLANECVNQPTAPYAYPHHSTHSAASLSNQHDLQSKRFEEALQFLFGQTSSEKEKPKDTPQATRKPRVHFSLDESNAQLSSAQSNKAKQSIKTSLKSASSPVTSQSQDRQVRTTPAASSLKDQLHARLSQEPFVEIHDTIKAILASLHRQQPSFTASASSKPRTDATNVSVPISSSTPPTASSSSSDKSKDKVSSLPVVEPFGTNSDEPTSADIAKSIKAVRNIEAAFLALQSDFVFPLKLDFTPTSSPASLPVSLPPVSEPMSTLSPNPLTTKLAYTSKNHAVRYYEQMLSSLLSDLDSVESFGNDEVRNRRKQVVGRVERALEELEEEVEGRWKVWAEKQAPEVKEAVKVEEEVKEETEKQQLKEETKEEVKLKTEEREAEVQPAEEVADTVEVETRDENADVEEREPHSIPTELDVVLSGPQTDVAALAEHEDHSSDEVTDLVSDVVILAEANEGVVDAEVTPDVNGDDHNDESAVEDMPAESLKQNTVPTSPVSTSIFTPTYTPSNPYLPEPSSEPLPSSSVSELQLEDEHRDERTSEAYQGSIQPVSDANPGLESTLDLPSDSDTNTDSDSDLEDLDTFLIPASSSLPADKANAQKVVEESDNSDSDWSEIEA
ncbi:hypothetical protein D9758_007478 [Tetrapyrgos nigripes]|uniref:BAG domain-containing protein n=1 Tax=Tetrapyrgos nigripes TaxID=182062 RepID=A0A8H5G3D6_9AGAR|nr:hypothetical protein D9758_007478 [Tetrapyrgos nigripes]